MRKRLAVSLAAVALFAVVGGIIAPVASSSAGADRVVRWDLVQFASGIVISGGSDVSVDEATGDVLTLTGSGHAEPGRELAFGGGTFVHEHADGTEVAHGGFYVTDLLRWKPIEGGSLAGTGLLDGIGDADTASSGILRLNINLVPDVNGTPGDPIAAILIIFCHLPGSAVEVTEGVRVKVPAAVLDFKQDSDPAVAGFTLFHVVR